jgi:hypothetical protein
MKRTSLQRSSELTDLLSAKLNEQPLVGTLRNRTAAGCFAIALEHQQSIVVLLEHLPPLHSSVFALIRPNYEAYVRGFWLADCATDDQIESFAIDGKPPDMASMIAAVEATGDFEDKQLSSIYANHWSSLCSFAHGGGLHVQRWNTAAAIEPNFDEHEINEALEFTAAVALLAAASLASLANNEVLVGEILEIAKWHAAKVSGPGELPP